MLEVFLHAVVAETFSASYESRQEPSTQIATSHPSIVNWGLAPPKKKKFQGWRTEQRRSVMSNYVWAWSFAFVGAFDAAWSACCSDATGLFPRN